MSDRRTALAPYEDTNFQVGDSPVALSVAADLGHPATRGDVVCDGTGNITVELASGGAYADPFTLKSGEGRGIDGLVVTHIRITHTGTDSAYRVVVA